jgi:hypothetical protein
MKGANKVRAMITPFDEPHRAAHHERQQQRGQRAVLARPGGEHATEREDRAHRQVDAAGDDADGRALSGMD